MSHGDLGPAELGRLVEVVRGHPGMRNKASIGLVSEVFGGSDWLAGPGDDGAVLDPDDTRNARDEAQRRVVACGEALWPPFVRADPFGAGFAAVLTNVNDLAAMGALPRGIVDTVVADEPLARTVLHGMRHACELYDVPILGGHMTPHDGEPSVSAFGIGTTSAPLSVTRMATGQSLLVAYALDGRMRTDFPFFPAFEQRGARCAGDIRLPAQLAAAQACVAAKDISMAGLVGSLGMLLERGPFGVTVDLGALPVPAGIDLADWLVCFPSFGFLLCVPPGREAECTAAFRDRGLAAAAIGEIDDSATVVLRSGTETVTALDIAAEPVTGLARMPA